MFYIIIKKYVEISKFNCIMFPVTPFWVALRCDVLIFFFQEEYMREGIEWKNIEYIDNTDCVSLFARKRTGLLALLDEECK